MFIFSHNNMFGLLKDIKLNIKKIYNYYYTQNRFMLKISKTRF